MLRIAKKDFELCGTVTTRDEHVFRYSGLSLEPISKPDDVDMHTFVCSLNILLSEYHQKTGKIISEIRLDTVIPFASVVVNEVTTKYRRGK